MKNGEIKAVEMVRQIRDKQHDLLKGKSPEERRRFYHEKAQALRDKLGVKTEEKKGA